MAPAFAKLGKPLRVRFEENENVCFSRSYDAAHLAALVYLDFCRGGTQDCRLADAERHAVLDVRQRSSGCVALVRVLSHQSALPKKRVPATWRALHSSEPIELA